MTYSIRIKRSALEQLQKIDRGTRERLIGQIDRLAQNPFVGTALEGELNGLRRVRHGAYRIVFEIRASELVVLVLRIGHRSQIYRR